MTALFHPTHPTESFEGRDAEFAFLSIFWMIRENFPTLRMTWEHLSDARCIPHLKAMQKIYQKTFVTITAHHLCGNEDKHHGDVSATCQPPIRAERDRTDLIKFVMENHEWVMGGLDDAPHPIEKKHVIGRCACGAYTTESGTLLYATALSEFDLFSKDGGFRTFQSFVSSNAAKYLDVPESKSMLEIVDTQWTIPEKYDFGGIAVIPFWGGKTIPFSYA